MPATPATTLKRTPLHARHLAHGARMVPFGGWEMPVSYAGIAAEHLAVRAAAGLFDVSHMGEVEIAGSGALAAVQRISCNDAARLEIGQAQYSALTTPEGTFLDDLLVYRLAEDHFLLVTNAANTPAGRRLDPEGSRGGRRHVCGQYEQPLCAARAAGTARAGDPAAADGGGARGSAVLPVHHGGGGGDTCHDLPHRLHR